MRELKKTIFLLNLDNYAPELTALTYPLIYAYAKKIGAGVHIIKERRFPEWDRDYEKLQIYELSREMENDWNIYIDSDAIIHPELPDITELIPMDTVAHNGSDFAGIRWKYDRYFRRDGRHIGSCNWLAVASSWCTDLWRPLDDMSFEEAVNNISLTVAETHSVVTKEHLVSDYALSRNIARFGLKFTTLNDVWKKYGLTTANFFYHEYTIPADEKIIKIREVIKNWKL
jgi:hypothetical protein